VQVQLREMAGIILTEIRPDLLGGHIGQSRVH
jgi:hypothetical protein